MPAEKCKILSNEKISDSENICVLKIAGNFHNCKMGQFYMVRTVEAYPLLSRPLSVYDVDGEGISFMYRIVGEGTKIFSGLKKDDEMILQGPYGNGYPEVEKTKKIALVGGGMGVAPLLYAAKSLNKPDIFLGFRNEILEEDKYKPYAAKLVTKKGGTIIDDINPGDYDVIFSCGPIGMEKALAEKVKGTKAKLYVSLEKHMACGIGACLVCSVGTVIGNKKVCKDGPVFDADEVLFNEL